MREPITLRLCASARRPPTVSVVTASSGSTSPSSISIPRPNDEPEPIDTRSFSSVVRAARQPSLTPPITQSSGTYTSERKTSLNIASPVSSRNGRMSSPSLRMSTKKHVMPLCFGSVGSVRARQMPQSASRAIDVQTFCPVSSHPPSARLALVDSDARSLPAPGSLKSWHQFISPRNVGPIQRCCCSGVPCAMSVGKAHAPTARCGRRTRATRNSLSITSCSSGDASRPHGLGQCGEM